MYLWSSTSTRSTTGSIATGIRDDELPLCLATVYVVVEGPHNKRTWVVTGTNKKGQFVAYHHVFGRARLKCALGILL
jgi:hypothetical protein